MAIPFDRILMDGFTDMVFIVRVGKDEDFYYDFLNRVEMDHTGLDENVIGKSLQEVYTGEMAISLQEQYKKVITILDSVTYKDDYISPNGKKRYSKVKLTPFFNQNNVCTHIVAVAKDITKRINIGKKLKVSDHHFRIIAEHADDLITLINDKGEIIYASPSHKCILGFHHKEYVGQFFLHNI